MRVHVSLKADDEATAGGKGGGPASFSWATLPTAFHGANMSGDYRPDQIAQLAKYLLRQIFLLILPPFRSTDIFDGAGTTW